MVELVIYLLTLAGIGTVTLLGFFRDLKEQTDRFNKKDKHK